MTLTSRLTAPVPRIEGGSVTRRTSPRCPDGFRDV